MTARELRRKIEKVGKMEALRGLGLQCRTPEEADAHLRIYVERAFSERQPHVAATILWGQDVFNFEIGVVKRVWNAYFTYGLLLIQAGSSLAKTYTLQGALLIDWWTDPAWTSVKLISVTGGHAQLNSFSTLTELHKAALIQMPGKINTESILLSPENKRMGFTILRIKDGQDAGQVLQGLHPIPRETEHPIFGKSSRERLYVDEAEDCPHRMWLGIGNFRSSMSGTETVKAVAPFNPKDIGSPVAQFARPLDGSMIGPDGPKDWDGHEGWHVMRLDARESENVQQRREVFPNLHTWESYTEKMTKGGGNSLERYAYVHGVYTPSGASNNIFSPELIEKCKGSFLFYAGTEKGFGVDIAVEGRDEAIGAFGRCGMASQFTHQNGTVTKFKQIRFCAQLDQFIELEKGSTKIVALSIIGNAKRLGIKGNYLAGDATGNGRTPMDVVSIEWDEGVMGIDFGGEPTEKKILDEDKKTPREEYERMNTELLYALQKWMDFGFFAISPTALHEMFIEELLGRKYRLGELKKVRAEDKADFKSRLGRSPDRLDAASLFLHACRMNADVGISMQDKKQENQREFEPKHGAVDEVAWVEGV